MIRPQTTQINEHKQWHSRTPPTESRHLAAHNFSASWTLLRKHFHIQTPLENPSVQTVWYADFVALHIIFSTVEHSGLNNFLCSNWLIISLSDVYNCIVCLLVTKLHFLCASLYEVKEAHFHIGQGVMLDHWFVGCHEGGQWPNSAS